MGGMLRNVCGVYGGWMPPLVFLPGAGGRASFWQPVAERLADLGRRLVFAYPGFGESPVDPSLASLDGLYRWLVKQLPAGPSHVIAQSMGGVLAVRLALERPELVSSLVLVATSGGVDIARLAGADWRRDARASFPTAPSWFIDDRTDVTDALGNIRARTLLLWSDAKAWQDDVPCDRPASGSDRLDLHGRSCRRSGSRWRSAVTADSRPIQKQ